MNYKVEIKELEPIRVAFMKYNGIAMCTYTRKSMWKWNRG